MSTTTMKTETMSKVLPGDKSGLPWELWQMILSYLNVQELCHACCVSKTWNDLVLSLDGTRWKELYLKCGDWKHPFWPLNVELEPPSWKQVYRDQYLSTRHWFQCSKDVKHSSCLYVLKRKKERKILRVGHGQEHPSLKSALSVANHFDRIEVYPGIYDEQFEMTSKIPFELVGVGELGSVILVVCIEQTAITGRVSNLVLRAPWFTTFILKIRSGYLQLDNCILEEGMVYAQHPGTCHIRFCTFRKSTVILQHTNVSIVENCEFSKSDTADIIVEGYTKEEKNWTYPYLRSRIDSMFSPSRRPRRHSLLTMKTTESQTSTLQSTSISLCHSANTGSDSCSQYHQHVMAEDPGNIPGARFLTGEGLSGNPPPSASSQSNNLNANQNSSGVSNSEHGCECGVDIHMAGCSHGSVAEGSSLQASAQGGVGRSEKEADQIQSVAEWVQTGENGGVLPPPLDLHNDAHSIDYDRPDSARSMHSRLSYESDEDSLSFLDDLESRSSSPDSFNRDSSSSDDDQDIERIIHTDSDDDSSSGEESVIMLPHLRQKDVHASISAQGMDTDSVSISSQSSQPLPIDIVQDSLMQSVVDQCQGCVIHHCRMLHSKGGVMVSLQAHAVVSECDISNVGYGIRCIQNSQVVILKNRIHHCRTSGIFMRLAASGLIAGNDIHSNMEAGIDIRKNADPVVQNNQIHHGKRSGIVVLGSGRGQIKKNDIYENREAGVYILFGGNPTVSQNHIFDGRAAGVAVNENGRGFIFDNKITSNQWGGVDIRHGSDPVVCSNTISMGVGDGIVIGECGKGAIKNNNISFNAGCGIWIMSASQPYLHGNQINNNGDSGIIFVNKKDVQQVHHIPDRMNLVGAHSPGYGGSEGDGDARPICEVATVQYNNIYHNAGKGIAVQQGDEVHIHFNAVHANQSDGITIYQNEAVVLRSNSVTNNRGTGIAVAAPSHDHQTMRIQGNGVYDNKDHGIVSQTSSHIAQNDVVGNLNGAISLDGNPTVTLVENRLQSPSGPCVKVVGVSQGAITDNEIYEDGDTWIRHDAFSQRIILENHVQRNMAAPNGSKSSFVKTSFLSVPPPRPAIDPPPAPSTIPAHNVTAITKVTLPSGDGCEQGSKLCTIL